MKRLSPKKQKNEKKQEQFRLPKKATLLAGILASIFMASFSVNAFSQTNESPKNDLPPLNSTTKNSETLKAPTPKILPSLNPKTKTSNTDLKKKFKAPSLSEQSKETVSNQVLSGDYKEAVPLLLPLAEAGDSEVQFLLALAYDKGLNYKKAIYWYRKAALQNHAEAQFSLAYMCEAGEGTEKNEMDALYWYKEAARQGLGEAQLKLGIMYEEGKVGLKTRGEPDLLQALNWYTKAAEQGLPLAQYALAYMYQEGHGTKQSDKKAAYWYEKSAQKGLAVAQLRTGLLYASGTGVKAKNLNTAAQWYERAAKQGLAEAQLLLGILYEEGSTKGQTPLSKTSFSIDYEKAAQWYKKAAEQGNDYGQLALGTFYVTGQGVDQDFILAYKWLNLSANLGNEEAISWLSIVSEEMAPEEISEGERMTDEWLASRAQTSASR